MLGHRNNDTFWVILTLIISLLLVYRVLCNTVFTSYEFRSLSFRIVGNRATTSNTFLDFVYYYWLSCEKK